MCHVWKALAAAASTAAAAAWAAVAAAFAAVCAQLSHLCDIVQVIVHKVLLGLKCNLHSLRSSNSAGSFLAMHSDPDGSHLGLRKQLLLLLQQPHLPVQASGQSIALLHNLMQHSCTCT
jgi:hypothetical protein